MAVFTRSLRHTRDAYEEWFSLRGSSLTALVSSSLFYEAAFLESHLGKVIYAYGVGSEK